MPVIRKDGLYVHGIKWPPMFRERVLDLYHENISQRQIAQLPGQACTSCKMLFATIMLQTRPFSLQSLPVQQVNITASVNLLKDSNVILEFQK